MTIRRVSASMATLALMLSVPAIAQDDPPIDMSNTAFSGDFLSVGVGLAIAPSYSGSDDFRVSPAPILQGSLGGIGINPRAAGLALDFIPDSATGAGFDAGIAARLRSDRAVDPRDDVVALYGELDRAIEVGPTVGVSFPQVLNPFDSLTFNADVLFDINGAHGGMVVSPSVAYFTPLSRAVAASFSVNAEWADEDFHDYYFRVDPINYIAPGPSPLPAFDPDGGGFTRAGATLLLAFDVDGDITNGGLGLVVIGGYSRMLGDAADTPFTSIRGSRNQVFGALGIGYTF